MRAFVDGYDRTVGIKEVVGVAPAVEWTYRPCAGAEAAAAYTTILLSEDRAAAKLEFVASKISAWRFPGSEDASPEFSAPTIELMQKLNAAAYNRIEQVVMGTGAPDYEIQLSGDVQEPALNNAEQAALDAKNSQAGSAS